MQIITCLSLSLKRRKGHGSNTRGFGHVSGTMGRIGADRDENVFQDMDGGLLSLPS